VLQPFKYYCHYPHKILFKMLKKILQDMWVDPDLLAELDESQKQTLFCRMREEQVRRWTQWDLDESNKPPSSAKRNNGCNKKQVDFLMGSDGEPWVWVMGEHPDDLRIEEILEHEAREKARRQAEKEAEQLRKSVEAELTELLDLNQKQIEAMEAAQRKEDKLEDEASLDVYCSVDDLRDKANQFPALNSTFVRNSINKFDDSVNPVADKRDALQEISLNKPKKVAQRVALWEKRVMEERTCEIFMRLQKKQMEVAREAEEAEQKQEQLWREQERKAKQAELQIREIARRAREEHRRTSVLDMEVEVTNSSRQSTEVLNLSPASSKSLSPSAQLEFQTAKPPSKEAVIEWFRSSEISRRAGFEPNSDQLIPWFHGLITRQEAESLLRDKPVGSFLVRLSERIWGYAITYRDADRCKHYLVDASSGHYQFLGANQITHNTLADMVTYHSQNPITILGDERLQHPCPFLNIPAVFQGLLGNQW